MAVAWIQMATTPLAGGSIHHTILLWPLPAMVMAVSFAAASRRLGRAGIPAVAVILAVLVASDVLVTNEYFWKSVRNGGSHTWTDALFPLSADLMAMRPAAVYCADWDIFESLRLLDRGGAAAVQRDGPGSSAGHEPGRSPVAARHDRRTRHGLGDARTRFEFFPLSVRSWTVSPRPPALSTG